MDATVFCFNRTVESGLYVNDCEMHIRNTFESNTLQTIMVIYNEDQDLTVLPDTVNPNVIENADELIKFLGISEENGLKFKIQKKNEGDTYYVAFDLRYYLAD